MNFKRMACCSENYDPPSFIFFQVFRNSAETLTPNLLGSLYRRMPSLAHTFNLLASLD